MSRDELLPTLLRVAREVLDDDVVFEADTPFEAIESWDSLNHVHMVVAMERAFGVRFNEPERLQTVVKVRDLLDLVAALKGL